MLPFITTFRSVQVSVIPREPPHWIDRCDRNSYHICGWSWISLLLKQMVVFTYIQELQSSKYNCHSTSYNSERPHSLEVY